MPLLQKGLPTSGTASTSYGYGSYREARAKVIAAEGEMRACLKEAGDVISTSPAALQIRTYQYFVSLAIRYRR